MKQKRSLSQVFLNDKKCIEKMVSVLDIDGKTVFEIGPGSGCISEHLAQRAKKFICVEIDPRFYKVLSDKFAQKLNTEVVAADVLKFPLSKVGGKIVVFGNVPYQISSDIIEYLISYRSQIKQAYLTFQKEFVQKLLAKPSSSFYGILSCRIQYYAKIKKIFDISAESFCPKPKVDSSFIRLEFYKKPLYKAKDEKFLFDLITKAFSQRRKKIINSLAIDEPEKVLLSLKINPNLRAEDLSLKEYVAIANNFSILSQK
ncbi:MAG: 16S rRNA (adenine(1518)-N(6)/adenine(1519)-N(6))-dimethyltransferase RsmA [Candidatus Omnitrophica bacterium]|nr:16S rRNA (adenine(1518)-N(6)/adenine(1519)-N(6))-dimethyltransferase RsmA [Candidatus Omnitrophota bacterium]